MQGSRGRLAVALIGALAVAALVPALGAGGSTPTVKRVNVSSAGAEANGFSFNPSVSADGRFVAFDSEASSLVAGDLNGASDVFVHDRRTGRTRRVSVRSTGAEGNDESFSPSVSADGRFVAFDSDASNLVAGDLNGAGDVFVHDRRTGRTTRVSLNSAGAGGNGESINPSISAGGRFVAFQSSASNLVAGDDNGFSDVFVRDRRTGRTRRMSLRSSGAEGNNGSVDPSVSADGRFVAFQSLASNLVAGDANDVGDVFVRDRRMGRTSRVSVSSAGAEGDNGSVDPSISADGRLVAFESGASNLVAGDLNGATDVFVRDRRTGRTSRVSVSSAGAEANNGSVDPSISADRRFVAFWSSASNLVTGDANGFDDVFVRDRRTGRTRRVSLNSAGAEGNEGSYTPAISAGGRFVAFLSDASNLVAGDGNGILDVFVRGPLR